jgi:N-acetylmuramoyl-L-alanine amidase
MKRKLFSAMLSAFALLLLMGAAAEPNPAYALLAEEESPASQEMELETEAQLPEEFPASEELEDSVPETPLGDFGNPVPEAPPAAAGDSKLLINGQPAPEGISRYVQMGTTYVALEVLAKELAPAAQVNWDGATMTVATDQLTMTAKVGQLYVEANGRYLYVPEAVQLTEAGQATVPLRAAAEAFGAQVGYDAATGVATVTSGSGAIPSGDSFYNQDDLFWLSRVIYRESGNQSLEGQMAVGNVVLNRVADPAFPDTVEGVLAQKNQFSTYKSGVLRKTEPSAKSIIAAKLVLDGGVVKETRGALFFDCTSNSWAARNKQLIATFGDHNFYG